MSRSAPSMGFAKAPAPATTTQGMVNVGFTSPLALSSRGGSASGFASHLTPRAGVYAARRGAGSMGVGRAWASAAAKILLTSLYSGRGASATGVACTPTPAARSRGTGCLGVASALAPLGAV